MALRKWPPGSFFYSLEAPLLIRVSLVASHSRLISLSSPCFFFSFLFLRSRSLCPNDALFETGSRMWPPQRIANVSYDMSKCLLVQFSGRSRGWARGIGTSSSSSVVDELITPSVKISDTQLLINGKFVDAASG